MLEGASVYGLWLDRKGRVIGDSHVIRGPLDGEFWIVSTDSAGSAIAGHLQAHIIADEVEVSDESPGWRAMALVGEGCGEWLTSAVRPGFAFPGRRAPGENWEWLFPEADAPAALAASSQGRAVATDEIERLRIRSAIASVPADIGPADLPNEGGLDAQAISYSKGCYTGQEVMARVKSLGRVRRTLVRVRGEGAPPALPAALWRGERRDGELRSAVADPGGFDGLALVSVDCAALGGGLSLAKGGPQTVSLVPAP